MCVFYVVGSVLMYIEWQMYTTPLILYAHSVTSVHKLKDITFEVDYMVWFFLRPFETIAWLTIYRAEEWRQFKIYHRNHTSNYMSLKPGFFVRFQKNSVMKKTQKTRFKKKTQPNFAPKFNLSQVFLY